VTHEPDEQPSAGAAPPAITRIEEEWEASRLGDGETTAAVRRITGEWTATRLASADAEPDADSGPPAPDPADAGSREPSSAARDATRDAAASEIDRLERRLDALASEQEQLAATVEQLQSQLSTLVTGRDGEPFEPAERRSPGDALAETRLLIRARSATDPALADVATGASREAVTDNLLFDPRTPFPAAETAVDGEPFEQFLEETPAYRLVTWLLTSLPFEIRNSSRAEGLRDVYEAFQSVDFATFGTAAAVADHAFDVTLRDGEGEPLYVVRIEQSPEPPESSAYEALLRAARDANAEHGSLAGAFLVTTSYVDESELDAVEDATKGGVFSRDKRESYVNVSGGGFHVCVVEGGETFRLRVPRL
jgi:hypothetical protein